MDVDDYIAKHDGEIKEIVVSLRTLVKDSCPGIRETIKWNVPTYSGSSMVCSIMAHKNHVNLQIFKGAQIKDAGLLDGTGKNMRHLKISTIEEINASRLKKVLQQAVELDA